MASEGVLQRWLAHHPVLLPERLALGEEPRRWLLVKREQGVAFEGAGGVRWSIDHLFLDQDGVPTLVEVKRSSDSRIRREVVGQMLDYAASAPFIPVEQIRAGFEEDRRALGLQPDAQIIELLSDEDADVDSFWATVGRNLREGRLRLLFVADTVPPELRRIVEFLNEQLTLAEVYAVEIRQFVGDGLRILAPAVVGATAAAQATKQATVGSGRTSYTWEEWAAKLAENVSQEAVAAIARIREWCRARGARDAFGAAPGHPDGRAKWGETSRP